MAHLRLVQGVLGATDDWRTLGRAQERKSEVALLWSGVGWIRIKSSMGNYTLDRYNMDKRAIKQDQID
jgi:hypothetical protein